MKIFLVEDEPGIARAVRRGLTQEHYEVDVSADGQEGLEKALADDYSLLILDIMLPSLDGVRICEEMRLRRKRVPILMLTARGDVPDRVKGLEAGADDYLPKPFEFAELLARVQALLRRDRVNRARVIQIEDLKIDTRMRLVSRAGREILLTQREYLLLEALAANEGHILTRDQIQERVWADDESYSNTVDVHIGQLRKKIDAASQIKLIHTVRGVGYTLRRGTGDTL